MTEKLNFMVIIGGFACVFSFVCQFAVPLTGGRVCSFEVAHCATIVGTLLQPCPRASDGTLLSTDPQSAPCTVMNGLATRRVLGPQMLWSYVGPVLYA